MVGLLSSFTHQETLKVQCVGFSAIMNNGGRCVATSSNIVLLLFVIFLSLADADVSIELPV